MKLLVDNHSLSRERNHTIPCKSAELKWGAEKCLRSVYKPPSTGGLTLKTLWMGRNRTSQKRGTSSPRGRRTVVKRYWREATGQIRRWVQLKYHDKSMSINHNQPKLNRLVLKGVPGGVQGNLDGLNQVTTADAVLNKQLMPHAGVNRYTLILLVGTINAVMVAGFTTGVI